MFVDTFTVQYIRKLRKNNEDEENEPKRITPFISIFAGIILLICSGILIVAKSNFLKKTGIHVPKMKIPSMEMKNLPNVKLPNVKLPHVKMPKFPSVPHIHFNAQRKQVRRGKPTDPVVAGVYVVRRLYGVDGVKCPDGKVVELWQGPSASGNGREVVFGATKGSHSLVGSLSPSSSSTPMWKKGTSSYFTLARYNGNERGIVEIDENTQVVRKINPGDGCLLDMKCVSLSGSWSLVSSTTGSNNNQCMPMLEISQHSCKITKKKSPRHLVGARVHMNAVRIGGKNLKKEMGYVTAPGGKVRFFDVGQTAGRGGGCMYEKMEMGASAGEQE